MAEGDGVTLLRHHLWIQSGIRHLSGGVGDIASGDIWDGDQARPLRAALVGEGEVSAGSGGPGVREDHRANRNPGKDE